MFKIATLTAALILVPGLVFATPIPPAGFNDDNGAELFNHGTVAIAVEFIDTGETVLPPGGFVFGFYFASDPNERITIFDQNDSFTNGSALASIDFGIGAVIDIDAGEIQDDFVTSVDPIGFWLALESSIFYSESRLNEGLFDPAYAFQEIANPENFLIGFETQTGESLSIEFVKGLEAIGVAEPGTLVLIAAGLMMFGLSARRRLRWQPSI